jgi:hypothetical protein
MSSEVSVRNMSANVETFFSSYKDARDNANPGDLITIYKDLDEQMFIKNGADIVIAPGVVFKRKKDAPPVFILESNESEIVTCCLSGLTLMNDL